MSGSGKYPLRDILRIRKIKLDAALVNLQKAKIKVQKHLKKIEKQKWRIEKYAEWLPTEETKLFNKIIKQVVKKDAVSDVKARIEQHKVRQKQHDERLKKLEEEQKQLEQEVEKARVLVQTISSDLEKINQHKNNWQTDYNKEQEALLEKETEDLKRKPNNFD